MAPVFTGTVTVSISSDNKYLTASWLTAITDTEDPFELDIEFAIGM